MRLDWRGGMASETTTKEFELFVAHARLSSGRTLLLRVLSPAGFIQLMEWQHYQTTRPRRCAQSIAEMFASREVEQVAVRTRCSRSRHYRHGCRIFSLMSD